MQPANSTTTSGEAVEHDNTELGDLAGGDNLNHGDQHHDFANPEELAKKWNDPLHDTRVNQSKLPSAARVKQFFAQPVERAKTWNAPHRDTWQYPDEIVAALGLEPGMTVADIGAGTGYMVAPLSKAVGKNGTVIAVDSSCEMIAYLNDRVADLGPAKMIAKHVGYHDPELPPQSIDRVLMLDTWLHLADRREYTKKVFSGLKHGGRFVVVDYTVEADIGPPNEMRCSTEQVSEQLVLSGFRVEIVSESIPHHYIVVGIKD